MSNKEIVMEFVKVVFNGKDLSVVDKYMKDDYKQHNPTVAQGKAGFIDFAQNRFFKMFPDLELRIKHVYEDGDIVVCHHHAVLKKGEVENIVFDVFRLEDGKLAEHWDCIQHLTPEQIPDADRFF
ncbi:MAG TPA: ester cyclase [Candidatus Scybalocola faecavium]|nr:ester cyclase [Candidatus Scybalocola faecavium]